VLDYGLKIAEGAAEIRANRKVIEVISARRRWREPALAVEQLDVYHGAVHAPKGGSVRVEAARS
jgi:hypothetical protein